MTTTILLMLISPSSLYQLPATKNMNRSVVADDYRASSRVHQAAQLQKLIRDGDYQRLQQELLDDITKRDMLWEPNPSSNWNCLHVAACQVVPSEWWRWLLEQAAAATASGSGSSRPRLLHTTISSRTALQESVLDLFLQTYTDPRPWQCTAVQYQHQQFVSAVRCVLSHPTRLHALQHMRMAFAASGIVTTWQDVPRTSLQLVGKFWIHLTLLCRAMNDNDDANLSVLEHLCHAKSCPALVAQLAMALQPDSAHAYNRHGQLPLHVWAQVARPVALPLTTRQGRHHDDVGMLQPLLQAYPAAATTTDAHGRYPLHLALAAGHAWASLRPLWKAAPHVLELWTDHMPAVALAAAASVAHQHHTIAQRARATLAGTRSLVIWQWLPPRARQHAEECARQQVDGEQLETIFHCLVAAPHVLRENKSMSSKSVANKPQMAAALAEFS